MNSENYPNLMCFGKDLLNCPLLDSCPDYEECEKYYEMSWFASDEEDKIYIVSFDKPIKISFEGFPIEIKEDGSFIKIPLSYVSGTKLGVICQNDFTPKQWTEIEKLAEENKKVEEIFDGKENYP